jgi:hypothetical protein
MRIDRDRGIIDEIWTQNEKEMDENIIVFDHTNIIAKERIDESYRIDE